MKYTDYQIGFQEFPDEVSLLINISDCPHKCSGCHSPELWKDIGEELNFDSLLELIEKNEGVSLVGFMGGDSNPKYINALAKFVKLYSGLKVGWYSGNTQVPPANIMLMEWFDYVKVGPYIKEKGPLNNPNTNQRMYKIIHRENGIQTWDCEDITNKFWKHGER